MYKNNYLRILFFIDDITAKDEKFDFDRTFDGTYGFSVNDASVLYELVHIIEVLADESKVLKSTKKEDSLHKEFKYQFNGRIFKVSRFYNNDEHSCIIRNRAGDDKEYVAEKCLMERVEAKCKLMEDRLNMIYKERSMLDSAG